MPRACVFAGLLVVVFGCALDRSGLATTPGLRDAGQNTLPDARTQDASPLDDGSRDSATRSDGGPGLCEVAACPSAVSTHGIGTANRDFQSIGAWETARGGDLSMRHLIAVSAPAGSFMAGERVVGASGCAGVFVPENDRGTVTAVLSLDGFSGRCATGEELRGEGSGATAVYSGHVAVGTIERGVAYADTAFEENVVIQGSTTDDEHYLWLTVAEGDRHLGIAGRGVVIDPMIAGHGIDVMVDHTRIEWVEVTDWTTDVAGSFDGIRIGADGVELSHVLVHDDGHGSASNSDASGINLEVDDATATVHDSVVYGIARAGVTIHRVTNARLELLNTTVYRCVEADNLPMSYGCVATFGASGSVIRAVNCIAMDAQNGGEDFRGAFDGAEANMSSDGSAPGTSPITGAVASMEVMSTAAGSEDLHLAATASALGRGVNLSSEVGEDIDGEPRPAPPASWDIGADQRTP